MPASAPSSFDKGIHFLIGEGLKGLVNPPQPCARREEEGEHLPGKLLPFPLREGLYLLSQGFDFSFIHRTSLYHSRERLHSPRMGVFPGW